MLIFLMSMLIISLSLMYAHFVSVSWCVALQDFEAGVHRVANEITCLITCRINVSSTFSMLILLISRVRLVLTSSHLMASHLPPAISSAPRLLPLVSSAARFWVIEMDGTFING